MKVQTQWTEHKNLMEAVWEALEDAGFDLRGGDIEGQYGERGVIEFRAGSRKFSLCLSEII